jgi:hypothetical protein
MSKKLFKGDVSFSFYFLVDENDPLYREKVFDMLKAALNDSLDNSRDGDMSETLSIKRVNDIFDVAPSFRKRVYDPSNDNIFLPEAYELGLGRSFDNDVDNFFASARESFLKGQDN